MYQVPTNQSSHAPGIVFREEGENEEWNIAFPGREGRRSGMLAMRMRTRRDSGMDVVLNGGVIEMIEELAHCVRLAAV